MTTVYTKEEKIMLEAASRLREIVRLDFEKRAAPLARNLLNQLGTRTSKLVKSLSDKTVIAVAIPLFNVLENGQREIPENTKEVIAKALKDDGFLAGSVTLLKSAATIPITSSLDEAIVAFGDVKQALNTLRKFQ